MRKLTFTLSAAALAIGGAGLAYANQHATPHGGSHGGPMTAADTDNDGVITRAEIKTHSASRFAQMDGNSDGVVNSEDREANRAERFSAADSDGDGELSAEEMSAARQARHAKHSERRAMRQAKRFEQIDTDNSGGISQTEMAAAKQARGADRGERRGKRGEMHHSGHHGKRHMAMRMLRNADIDGDKSVTRAEFDAAVEVHFARVDTDGSGSITAEERKAAMAAMKEQMQQRRGDPPS